MRGEFFFLLLIRHEQAAAFHVESEIVHTENAHPETDLRANRVQRRIECFLGDAEIRQTHWHNAVLAPDKQCQRRDHRRDLERAGLRERVVCLQLRARRINNYFQRSQQRMDSNFRRRHIRGFELISRVNFGVELDRLNRRPGQAQRF